MVELVVTEHAGDGKGSTMSADERFSLVLFSGTDDKLQAAATLAVGAAVMGRPVESSSSTGRSTPSGPIASMPITAWRPKPATKGG